MEHHTFTYLGISHSVKTDKQTDQHFKYLFDDLEFWVPLGTGCYHKIYLAALERSIRVNTLQYGFLKIIFILRSVLIKGQLVQLYPFIFSAY